MRRLALLMLVLPHMFAAAAGPPAGEFGDAQCLRCHAERDAGLIAAWRASGHGRATKPVGCVACHGARHRGALSRARRDDTCVACHAARDRAVVHSYATSKHATIMALEADQWDWSRPLARGNYRAPGCAYCHLHAGGHDSPGLVAAATHPRAETREEHLARRQAVCGECHAPRYVAAQTGVAERMIEIADMKLREARALVARYRAGLTPRARDELDGLLVRMADHAGNVRVGNGHQSPDYQWWHGHPALDGDLLRVKGVIAGEQRPE